MNFIRRFYLAILSIVLIIGVSLFLIFPQTVSDWSAVLSEQTSILRVLVALVIDLLLLAFLYLQVRPDPRARATGLMMQASGAITEVSVESARTRILKAVSDVPDVVSADAEVKPIRGRADVELQVTVMGHDVQLPAKQKEINRALNQVIHKQLGLQMAGQPRVHIRFHGEEAVKPSVPPSIVSQPEKPPVEVVAPIKAIAVEPSPEPEPQKSLGVFSIPKNRAIVSEPKTPESSVEKVLEESAQPGMLKEEAKESDANRFTFDLEKEIEASSTEDIMDEEDSEESKPSPDDATVRPVDTNNHQKEANFDNNRI